MSSNTSVIKAMALKLGLMNDVKVIRKAEEYERLYSLRLNQANNINCTAKAIMFLDLAASFCGSSFNVVDAINLSGLKKSVYVNNKHTIENSLNLNRSLTIKNFCIANDCINAVALAENIIKKYQECDIEDTDLTHPQFIAMAVYHSCRLQKIKVPKDKFLKASNLKSSHWSRLEDKWTRLVDKHFGDSKQFKSKTSKKNNTDVQDWIKEIEKENPDAKVAAKTEDKEAFEEYASWKERILKEARKELKEKSETLHMKRRLF